MSSDGKIRDKSGRFGPGNPGKPKGAKHKSTSLLKDAIVKAAENAGNKIGDEGIVSYLEEQATKNPGPFMALLGKVLPMQVEGTGKDGEMTVKVVTGVPRDSD
jgi:hypothetical protein